MKELVFCSSICLSGSLWSSSTFSMRFSIFVKQRCGPHFYDHKLLPRMSSWWTLCRHGNSTYIAHLVVGSCLTTLAYVCRLNKPWSSSIRSLIYILSWVMTIPKLSVFYVWETQLLTEWQMLNNFVIFLLGNLNWKL